MTDILNNQKELYRLNFVKHGDSPEGLFWNNITTQHERFAQLMSHLLPLKSSDFSICDIGCGTSHLHQYLLDNNIKHRYTGTEIVPEMIEKSKQKFKDVDIRTYDILDKEIDPGTFDFVVLSGTFNLRGSIGEKEWKNFVFKMIKRMFEISEIGISFNTLTSYSTFTSPGLCYISPEEMLSFIQTNLSRFYIINTAYPLYEVTYTVLKQQTIEDKFKHEHFSKYFKK